jgi:hypothetical protein
VFFVASCGTQIPDVSLQNAVLSPSFPKAPDENLTPGSICSHPDTFRYPEHVGYCQRDVDASTKRDVIQEYDNRLGFKIGTMNRSDFKIDHYIPLCMGGANSTDNLWPQHKSVYTVTDPIEPKLCNLMAVGHIQQAEAIRLIKGVKHNLNTASDLNRDLDSKLAK